MTTTINAAPGLPIDARGSKRAIVLILLGAAVVELLLFIWLVAAGHKTFVNFVWTPDTASYIRVSEQLAQHHTLAATPRTLGYPLFAAAAYYIGGQTSGLYIVIAVQLLLNLGLTWLGWRLLERTASDVRVSWRVAATLFLFVAGMGMAAFVMTDLLAAGSFAIFLYGLLFWRDSSRALIAGAALACATLTRPTFTFVPLLLPAAAYFVRHVTSRIPAAHVLLFVAFSLVATSVSLAYQYTFNRYLGPSPLLHIPIQEMLYHGVVQHQGVATDYVTFQREFATTIEERAGRPLAAISLAEREAHAKQLFREEFRSHPFGITAVVVTNAVKYMFAPVESLSWRTAAFYMTWETYERYLRPVIAAACLPIFVLSLLPPAGHSRAHRMYYALTLMLLLYIIGFSAIGAGSGERIRFPMLVFMTPVALWNASSLRDLLQARFGEPLLSSGNSPINRRAS